MDAVVKPLSTQCSTKFRLSARRQADAPEAEAAVAVLLR